MQKTIRLAIRAIAVAGLVLLSVPLASSAAADTPESWDEGLGLSGLDVLLVYAGIPLGLCVVIALLASINPGRYANAYPIRHEERADHEWFGRTQVADADHGELTEGSQPRPGGGASASW